MFNNLVNAHDLLKLVEKIRQGDWKKILSKFSQLKRDKVESVKRYWDDPESNVENPPVNWWDIPAVRKRWNFLISGDPETDYVVYISRKYLADRAFMSGLSLGCGCGLNESKWVMLGKFKNIDATDISEESIKHAKNKALNEGYGDVVNYRVADVYKSEIEKDIYDVIIVEHSLHHFSPLREILTKIHDSLKPDGYFIVNEFAGPTRFQWTDRQINAVNGLLSVIPARYRVLWNSDAVKFKTFRPSRLSMILKDPSEAVESGDIIPLLKEIFEVVELKSYGGNVLHLLFNGIAHNFMSGEPEAGRMLRFCFEAEDILLDCDDFQSDFVIAVCRKRTDISKKIDIAVVA